jgi:hypothetical protein
MATDFRIWLNNKEALQSMTRKDNHYDNAHAESLFSRFKAELMQNSTFDTFEDAQMTIIKKLFDFSVTPLPNITS